MKNKSRKITVLLEDVQFEKFESYCIDQGHKKSTLICKLINDFLSNEKPADKTGRNDRSSKK